MLRFSCLYFALIMPFLIKLISDSCGLPYSYSIFGKTLNYYMFIYSIIKKLQKDSKSYQYLCMLMTPMSPQKFPSLKLLKSWWETQVNIALAKWDFDEGFFEEIDLTSK